jgi:hypothetical protein
MSLSSNDKKLLAIMDTLKLDINKVGHLTHAKLAPTIIKAMRMVDGMSKINGQQKMATVVNLILLLIADMGTFELILTEQDIIDHVQDLFDIGVIAKKKCC